MEEPSNGSDTGHVPEKRKLDPQLYILSFSKLFKDLGTGMLAFLIPLYIVGLHSSVFADTPIVVKAGIVATVFGISNAFSQPLMGRLSDRLDRRKVFIVAGMLGFTVLSFIYANTGEFEYIVFFRFIQGITVGATVPAIVAMVTHLSTSHTRGKAIGIYSSLRGFGFGTGSLLGGIIVNYYDFSSAFYVCALLGLISTFSVSFFVNETRDTSVKGGYAKIAHVKDLQFPVLASAMFMMMVGIMIIFAFLPEYRTRLDASELSLSIAVSAYVLSRIVFQTPMGEISDRIGRKRMVAMGLLINVPIVVGLGYVESIVQLISLRAFQGIAMAAVETPVMALAVELTGGSGVGSKVSTITASQAAGMALGPLLGGLLAGYVSFRAPFYLCGALILLSFLLVLAVVRDPEPSND
ncbi:MFS transporter [Methanolobus halotolerans]|uniref:MFS transporter n=1 Tax=Methanolobus halotolerans TaxID=2052935 RepID=A0A4E0PYX6_9EURY|nr:MFS transporter [Methanolobus halotolerans]TGC11508.1 MFS transporter [Methanolobus halotolerans]